MANENLSQALVVRQPESLSKQEAVECVPVQPLSDYEMDAMWMSYRYAIGRHSIASVTHAGQLVQAVYHRLTEKRDFTAYDMRREINRSLEFSINFGLDLFVPERHYDPLKILYQFSLRPEVLDAGGFLNYLQNNRVTVSMQNQQYAFHVDEPYYKRELHFMDIQDLIVWANAANALDNSRHFIATVEYNGRTEKMEVFEYFAFHRNEHNEYDLTIEFAPVGHYLANPQLNSWIAREYIKKLEPMK